MQTCSGVAAGVSEGSAAPDFSVNNQKGEQVTLSKLLEQDQRVLLWFYPRDCTSGCTKEGIRFTELHSEFASRGVGVYGVSADDEASHQHFIDLHGFPFDLLADSSRQLISAYGAVKDEDQSKILRSSFLINREGRVEKSWRPVTDAATHPDEVLEYIQKAA